MFRSSFRFAAVAILVLAYTLALGGSVCAQRSKGDEGTGGAAGYSPPIDVPDANAPMQKSIHRDSARAGRASARERFTTRETGRKGSPGSGR